MASRFRTYADLAMSNPAVSGLRPVVEKELLHYEILNAMSREGLLRSLVFQGGTALRLCHGAVRYSEDLDFSGGPVFTAEQAGDIAGAIRLHISDRYDLPVEVIAPKERALAGSDPVKVLSWSIRIETQPGGRNLPAQRIKVDIDTSRSHTRENSGLQLNYEFLPASYGEVILPVQSLAEIMANKLIAFPISVQGRNRPRYRDIWDLRWLARRNIRPEVEMISAKAIEHGVDGYADCLGAALDKLQEIMRSTRLTGEMSRFLPSDVLTATMARKEWLEDAEKTLKGLMRQTLDGLLREARPQDFDY